MKVNKILVILGGILAALLIGGGIWFRFRYTGFFEPRCVNPSMQVERMDAFDACVAEVVEHHGVVGMSVAVVTADGGSWSSGYGYANIEEERVVTPDTPFLLSSITKTFVAVAVMQQVEDHYLVGELEQPGRGAGDELPVVAQVEVEYSGAEHHVEPPAWQ